MIRREYWIKRITKKYLDKATQLLEGEVNTFDQYISGEVYSFIIENDVGDVLDSCSGFYEYEYCKEEATSSAKYHAEEIAKIDESAA